AWLEQNTALPQPPCRKDKDCEDK
ncbi:hypothetical protein ACTBFF_004554, partial [Salmonella enterica subsp. enterica serovar Reading]